MKYGVLVPPATDGLSGNPYLLGNSVVSVAQDQYVNRVVLLDGE